MIHTKAVLPRVFPRGGSRDPEQIDRVQTLDGDLTLSKEKLYEIGRENLLAYRKGTPKFTYTMKQYEYGSMAFYRALANLSDPESSGLNNAINLSDLATTRCDIAAFLTDDNDVFQGSIWFPNLRVNGLTINIGNPDAVIERNFDLVGEAYNFLENNYLAYQKSTAPGAGDLDVVLDPVPVAWSAANYILTVLRVRNGVLTVLEEGNLDGQWSFSGPATVRAWGCEADDTIKVFYEAATAYTTLWTDNDVDVPALYAECAEIYMKVGTSTKIYRLQSVGIDCAFERADWKEIGNPDIVQTGIKSKTVTVTLNRYSEDMSLEKILAGDSVYPYFDPTAFVDNIQLMVKIYTDKTHDTFSIGYLITDLSPTTLGTTNAVEDYQQRTNALEADNLKVSDDESEIVFA
jgi:hypothetical protein